MTILEKAKIAAKAMSDKKAFDITCLEVTDLTTIADYFVICSASNILQLKAIAEEVEDKMTLAGFEPHKVSSQQTGQWILLDYTEVLIHVFCKDARDFYKLENLWNDAKSVDIQDVIE